MADWTQGLNEEQKIAVEHDHGPLLILAGAGSGKTTVLVARAGRLLTEQICTAEQLCVLTFTNRAARELKSRVTAKLGSRATKIWAGTFHSFGLHLLRRFYKKAKLSEGFGILDASDAGAIVKEILRDFSYGGKTAYDAEKLLSLISTWRESNRTTAIGEDEYEIAVEWLLPRYLKRLEMLGMVDFDSLILKPLELMKEFPEVKDMVHQQFQQIMVDEFQDTNQMQMNLVRRLAETHRNLTVVGDDDQSIYAWRGACISNILDFPKLYSDCKVIRLERNYRSTPAILNLANAVIAKNTQRHPKVLRSSDTAELGELPQVMAWDTEDDEAENICSEIEEFVRQGFPKKEIAVLYRSNSQGALIEAELRRRQIPYSISGGTAFFDRKEMRDILAYLRCALKPNEVALRRILNTPPRGIGDKTVELLTEFMNHHNIKFPEATKRWKEAQVEERAGASIEVLWEELRQLIPSLLDPAALPGAQLLGFLSKIGYKGHLEKYSGNAQVAAKRWRYLEVFSGIIDRFVERGGRSLESIRQFLDAMELRDLLSGKEEDEDRVQLLTLHACKGLEFNVVLLIGVEEDILPHRILGTNLSEERRLFYVGITRARQKLIISRASKRRRHGKLSPAVASRFLEEIPKHLLTIQQGPRPMNEDRRKSMIADLFKKLDNLGMTASAPKPVEAQPEPPREPELEPSN